MPYSIFLTTHFEVMQGDTFGVNGRTVESRMGTVKAIGADLFNEQAQLLSAGLSAQLVNIAPFSDNLPAVFLRLETDQPVDLRFHAASGAVDLSAVQQLTLAGSLSALWVTTGTTVTKLRATVVGGSAAVIQANIPFP